MVLRLPSLIAAVAVRDPAVPARPDLISREAARLAVLVFAARQVVAFEASEARPYAMATLAVIASTYALVRWLDDGRRWSLALVYALLAVTVVWLHYLFALVLVPTRCTRSSAPTGGDRGTVRRLAAVAVIVVAGIVPLADPARLAVGSTLVAVDPERRVRQGFAVVLLPPVLVASLFLGSLFARMRTACGSRRCTARSSTLVLLGTWLLFPVVTLFLVSALTPLTFLSLRYFASVAPADRPVRGLGDRVAGAGRGPSDRRDRPGDLERPGVRRAH